MQNACVRWSLVQFAEGTSRLLSLRISSEPLSYWFAVFLACRSDMKPRAISVRLLSCVLACLMAAPCWVWAVKPAPELPDPGHVGMSRDQQVQVGLQAVAEVYKQMPVLPDSNPVTQYV